MLQFIRHEFDVFVSTTIVENGLDIPLGQHDDHREGGTLRAFRALPAAGARGALEPARVLLTS